MAKKEDDEWDTDMELIREISEQEKQAEEDRLYAAILAGMIVDRIPSDTRKLAILPDESDDDDDDNDKDINMSVVQIIRNTNSRSKPKKCAICIEVVNKNDPRTPCGHSYCIQCLRDLFMRSMQDETLMPPRCCQKEIPIVLAKLTLKEMEDFNAKCLEYSTRNRLYCSRPTCSTFIPPTCIVNRVGTCPNKECGATTCSICKTASHNNTDCPKDEDIAAVLAVAREAGWSRCERCQAVIELTYGCFHMTCRCRAEFCYICSKTWKTCPCPQWDEARLYEEARIRTERIFNAGMQQGNGRFYVEQIANQLRANHECQHQQGWAYTTGGGQCDRCSDYLPLYLYRCNGCHYMACNRCRRNRL